MHVMIADSGLYSDQEKVSWLGSCCAADSDWNSAEALDCSQLSCQCINPRHTLQLWPQWASIAAVIQLPGRETCTASKADNNEPELENSSLLLQCQQSVSLSLLARHCAAAGPAVVRFQAVQSCFYTWIFSVIIKSFGWSCGISNNGWWLGKRTWI